MSGSAIGNYTAKTNLQLKVILVQKLLLKLNGMVLVSLATKLNADNELNEMIAKQSIKDATIYVEPTDTAVRIRSKWDNHIAFGITKELFEIYDQNCWPHKICLSFPPI